MTDTPVTPIPSATVILVRKAADGFEILMVKRHHQIEFASGALVFPGGKSDAEDEDSLFEGLMQQAVKDKAQRSLQVTAIRELFEESGILLACDDNGRLVDDRRLDELDSYRQAIHQKKTTFADFLTTESLKLANRELAVFAHWITPKGMPKRFDTWFYLAPAPATQVARHDQQESVDSLWLTPAQAIADAQAGKRTIIFPTMRNIAKLNQSNSPEELWQRARAKPPMAVEPWVEKREDGRYLCIPPEAGYDISEEKLVRGRL